MRYALHSAKSMNLLVALIAKRYAQCLFLAPNHSHDAKP